MSRQSSSDVRDLVRRAFLVGYDCGRQDERELGDEADAELPENVVSFESRRGRGGVRTARGR